MRAGFVLVCILIAQVLFGCVGRGAVPVTDPVSRCYSETSRAIRAKPVWTCLPTLDGRCVPLAPFLARCAAYWPDCVLFPKFYYWPNHIEERIAQTPKGAVIHKIRFYDNLRSACDPDFSDPGRTHGDVAEFYDGQGRFMGLAVYMGKGLYVPLPFDD
jgi:hypothetical protein